MEVEEADCCSLFELLSIRVSKVERRLEDLASVHLRVASAFEGSLDRLSAKVSAVVEDAKTSFEKSESLRKTVINKNDLDNLSQSFDEKFEQINLMILACMEQNQKLQNLYEGPSENKAHSPKIESYFMECSSLISPEKENDHQETIEIVNKNEKGIKYIPKVILPAKTPIKYQIDSPQKNFHPQANKNRFVQKSLRGETSDVQNRDPNLAFPSKLEPKKLDFDNMIDSKNFVIHPENTQFNWKPEDSEVEVIAVRYEGTSESCILKKNKFSPLIEEKKERIASDMRFSSLTGKRESYKYHKTTSDNHGDSIGQKNRSKKNEQGNKIESRGSFEDQEKSNKKETFVNFFPADVRQKLARDRIKRRVNYESEHSISPSVNRKGPNLTKSSILLKSWEENASSQIQVEKKSNELVQSQIHPDQRFSSNEDNILFSVKRHQQPKGKLILSKSLLTSPEENKILAKLDKNDGTKVKQLFISLGPTDLLKINNIFTSRKSFSSQKGTHSPLSGLKMNSKLFRSKKDSKPTNQLPFEDEIESENDSEELIEYIIDDENYLCDQNGIRILDDFGQTIHLEREHIEYFRSHQAYQEIEVDSFSENSVSEVIKK